MAYVLIIVGIILLSLSIYKKIRIYNLTNSYENNDIEEKLDHIITNIASSQQNINQELGDIKEKFDRLNTTEKKENKSFKNVLKNYQQEQNIPQKYREVFEMIKKGKNCQQIASELKMGIRETELIAKLYRKEADNHV